MTKLRPGQFSFDDQLKVTVVASKATEKPQKEKQTTLDVDGKAKAWTDATKPE